MTRSNRLPNESDPICEAPDCPKTNRHFVPLNRHRPQRFHDNECKGLAMVTKVWVTCTGCDRRELKRPDVLHADGTWTCVTCENKSRGTDERVRFDSYAHGAGTGIEPAHAVPRWGHIGPCTE